MPKDRIVPIRLIPFDIGRRIDERLCAAIKRKLTQRWSPLSEEKAVVKLLKVSTNHFTLGFHIEEAIDLYIFDFGIGVFVVRGESFIIEEEDYADTYCACRKEKHESYLQTDNVYSCKLREIARTLRHIASDEKHALRVSASEHWEYRGLSYVMTISHIIQGKNIVPYGSMTEQEKRNLQIMLEPSIAYKEDSLIYSCYGERDDEAHAVDLSQLDTPSNWLNNDRNAIYISWAAVLLYGHSEEGNIQNILVALEISLQAMWMNTYCLYENLTHREQAGKSLVSKLQTELFGFRRTFNEFKRIADSSLPAYVTRIRNELIRTSGIDEYAKNYQAELEYLIAERNSINAEKQKKYSWLSEFFLFLIAFIQIAPILYTVLANGMPSLKPMPVILMTLFVVVATVILIKKN